MTIPISADDVTKLSWVLGASPGDYATGVLTPAPEHAAAIEAILADPDWRGSAAPPVPDATPLQLVEEMETRTLGDGTNMADRFLSLMSQRDLVKFTSARVVHRDDPRIDQFQPALELDGPGIDDLFRAAAAR